MSQKKRKFSLDSSVQEGVGLTRGRRGSWKKGQPQHSLDEARQHIQELNRSLPATTFRREQSIAEESFERTDINSSIPKHNKSFHKLFPEIPDKESMTHAFTCALQKDGLYQGKLFVSENNVCFYSSVLLKETKVIIPVSSVRQVKKHQSAMSLLIQSADGEKYLFVSLMNRGMCYKLLQSVCSHILPESNSSSPRVSSGENEVDFDVSSNSSREDSFDNHLSSKNNINNDFAEFSSEVQPRLIPPSQNIVTDQGNHREWIRSVANWITSLFFISETRNVHVLFYAYIILLLLLLLTSGYIGLRIIALEEHLTSLDSVAPASHHTGYKET
ncbi:GRAM domain-containing protein 2B-like isoform X2 [Periophthalmus magnuspinnatus]|uniref:GRAM domain-containing protein 2B-like isoform X2 n=1 Tax=Periophthalmus magnuspinnatus TaxID=409849 RepID=UPI002436838C|nr:GRAM domain-containing protein 2B-like isoform X2 [Periophthalmus magnuspinnatus]